MKFTSLILGFLAGSFLFSAHALEKTQEEAQKFLVDGGQVSSQA